MARPGDVIDAPSLGVRIEFRRTTEETGGELLEFDIVGRPKGFITQAHVHPDQTERIEVIEGRMRMRAGGRDIVLGPGEAYETAPGRQHRHGPAGDGPGRVRVRISPARRTEAWLERVGAMDRDGRFLRSGYPRPVAGARLIRDYADEARAASPPPRVQQALATAILKLHGQFDNEYVFVDEWDVRAPAEAVFATLSDGRTYRGGGGPSTCRSTPTARASSATAPRSISRAVSPTASPPARP